MFDKLASFTPEAAITPTQTKNHDVLGLVNLFSGGQVKANRELEKINLQHLQNMELSKWNALWNKAMDDTKAQRHMKDLEKAGINPILAHGQSLTNAPTSGASAGSSSAGSGSGADASGKLKKAVKLLATLVLKSF